MNTMYRKPAQLSVIAVAALAIVAVAAAMLLAGGNPAQATTASTLDGVSGGHLAHDRPSGQIIPTATPSPTPTPRTFPPEPACPEVAAPAVDSGHIALFDVWWNPEELELTNSSCPPTVRHVPAQGSTAASDVRTASNINIDETVIHIPNSARVTLSETNYPSSKYPALWDADDAENPDGEADRIVWALPACPPDGSSEHVDLCLSFSAALLNKGDWIGIDDQGNGGIVYHLDHVHQLDIDRQDPRYVLVYDAPGEGGPMEEEQPLWNSFDASVSKVHVSPGGYNRPMWFFTSPGTYEFQVHITGYPNRTHDNPISQEPSVNDDQRTYILHVGAESDVGVTVTATPESPAPGDLVAITVRASNYGPDEAPNVKVDVALPDGLEYVSHERTFGTFAAIADDDSSDDDSSDDEESENTCACETPEFEPTHTWSVGIVSKNEAVTLDFKARVAQGTRGQELKVKAKISATQAVTTRSDNFDVPVPDKESGNNMGMDTVTVPSIPNVEPLFSVARSVPENTPHEHPVGDPIPALSGDGDTLTYTLTGNDASSFMVESVAAGAQIRVHGSADLDFETKASYQVVLNVSDGKDAHGNPDDPDHQVIDSSIAVPISITDVAETVRVTASCEKVGHTGTCEATVSNLRSGDTVVRYSWTLFDLPTNSWHAVGDNSPTYSVTYSTPGTRKFQVHVTYTDANGKSHYVHSGFPALTW